MYPGHDTEILQIACTDGITKEFNIYIKPTRQISPSATAVNKLTFMHGTLFFDGRPLEAVTLNEALKELINWLQQRSPCLLIAHNCKSFDSKHLVRGFESHLLLDDFQKVSVGFSDTLPVFRELYPELKSHSQQNLATNLLGVTYDAHNALSDIQVLHKLTSTLVNTSILQRHSFSVPLVKESLAFHARKRDNLKTMKPLTTSKVISNSMAEKIAGSGLTLQHLTLAFRRGGIDGIRGILTEKVDGKYRVTSNNRIINQIFQYINS